MNATVKIVAPDVSVAAETVKSIVAEYNGHVGDSSVSESSAYITAYVPAQELAAFKDALAYAGTVDSSRVNGEGGDTVAVTITIKAE